MSFLYNQNAHGGTAVKVSEISGFTLDPSYSFLPGGEQVSPQGGVKSLQLRIEANSGANSSKLPIFIAYLPIHVEVQDVCSALIQLSREDRVMGNDEFARFVDAIARR